MIPPIVHFVWFEKDPDAEFLFVHYMAVLSAYKVNKPSVIYFYFDLPLKGRWWEETLKIVTPVHRTAPTTFRGKKITQAAHQADIVRLEVLRERGGTYLDVDTVSFQSWSHLLIYDFVMGSELTTHRALCNAVIFANKDSKFLNYWFDIYSAYFREDGWAEASCHLPSRLSESPLLMEEIVVTPVENFFEPGWGSVAETFILPNDPSPKLITLHLWSSYSKDILKIIDEHWIETHPETLYAKIVKHVLSLP